MQTGARGNYLEHLLKGYAATGSGAMARRETQLISQKVGTLPLTRMGLFLNKKKRARVS